MEFSDISLFDVIYGDDRDITDECVLCMNKGHVNFFMCNALNVVGNKLNDFTVQTFTEDTLMNCSMFRRFTDFVYRSGNTISTEPRTKYLVIDIKYRNYNFLNGCVVRCSLFG